MGNHSGARCAARALPRCDGPCPLGDGRTPHGVGRCATALLLQRPRLQSCGAHHRTRGSSSRALKVARRGRAHHPQIYKYNKNYVSEHTAPRSWLRGERWRGIGPKEVARVFCRARRRLDGWVGGRVARGGAEGWRGGMARQGARRWLAWHGSERSGQGVRRQQLGGLRGGRHHPAGRAPRCARTGLFQARADCGASAKCHLPGFAKILPVSPQAAVARARFAWCCLRGVPGSAGPCSGSCTTIRTWRSAASGRGRSR